MSAVSNFTATLVLHRDEANDRAILVSETGDARRAVWLPRRFISYAPTGEFFQTRIGAPKLAVATVDMPLWLARDRNLSGARESA
jgi:hypothetical protein